MVAPARAWLGRLLHVLPVLFLTAVLVFAVLFLSTPIAQTDRAGRDDRNLFLLVLGLLGVAHSFYSIRRKKPEREISDRKLGWLALLLPCYAAFQILPLPVSALRVLSPARAELVDALAPLTLRGNFAPLSVTPSLSLVHFLLFAAYVVVFFLVRSITRSNLETLWLPVFPIIVIAAWQGAWGMQQFFAGGPDPFAHGAYTVKNHYAGFLEMSLPFAIAFAIAALQKSGPNSPLSMTGASRAAIGAAAASLIVVGILFSLSRMGMISSIGSLCVMGMLALAGRLAGRQRWLMLSCWALAVVLAFAFLAPTQLVIRFGELSPEGRLDVWKDTLHLIAGYPVFGTGLGGYESAFEKFKTTGFVLAQDYAHNDYLQFFAELGLIGFLIGSAFLVLILLKSMRVGLGNPNPDTRWMGLACTGALVAILIHSAADFNLYVPVNATLLAWICGLTAGLVESPE